MDKERHSGSGSRGVCPVAGLWSESKQSSGIDPSTEPGILQKRLIFSSLDALEISSWDLLSCHVRDTLQLCFAASDTGIKASSDCQVAEVVARRQGGLRISTPPRTRNQYLAVQGSLHYHQS